MDFLQRYISGTIAVEQELAAFRESWIGWYSDLSTLEKLGVATQLQALNKPCDIRDVSKAVEMIGATTLVLWLVDYRRQELTESE